MSAPFAWTGARVREALGVAAADDVSFTGICTDSRKVRPGELYVALSGDTFDGHDFVAQALAAGAAGAVVGHAVAGAGDAPLFVVDDTLVALGRLASFRRAALTVPVIGITGSSGKTSTKDFMRGALASTLRVHATTGNLNNRIGVPMTLLATAADAQVVVVEMGTNEPGEIRTLTAIARPTVGVLTTVGESHLEKLGSVMGVLDEKLDLIRGLPEDGWGVVGDEPPMLPERARSVRPRLRVAGWSERADEDLRPVAARADGRGAHAFEWRGEPVTLSVPGKHMVLNALLALTVAEIVGVPAAAAAAGVSGVQPGWMRSQVEKTGGLTLMLDCYNANPQSTRAALDVLALHDASAGRIAVLGSMLELGDASADLHLDVLRGALKRDLRAVVAIGAFAEAGRRLAAEARAGGPTLVMAADPDEAYPRLRELLSGDEVVLLKASRGVALETLLPRLREDFGGGAAPAGPGGH